MTNLQADAGVFRALLCQAGDSKGLTVLLKVDPARGFRPVPEDNTQTQTQV